MFCSENMFTFVMDKSRGMPYLDEEVPSLFFYQLDLLEGGVVDGTNFSNHVGWTIRRQRNQ